MPRPKAFNRDYVLEQAMLCFWKNGFTATSMKHLEAATALTPGSLYNSFGSKDGLFLECLDFYVEGVIGQRIQRYLKPCEAEYAKDPLRGVEEFIRTGFTNELEVKMGHLGCLVVNTSAELGPHDGTVRKQIQRAMSRVMAAIQYALSHAQKLGQLDASVDVKQRAQLLGLLFNGMLVQWRASTSNSWLDTAMSCVRESLK